MTPTTRTPDLLDPDPYVVPPEFVSSRTTTSCPSWCSHHYANGDPNYVTHRRIVDVLDDPGLGRPSELVIERADEIGDDADRDREPTICMNLGADEMTPAQARAWAIALLSAALLAEKA